MKPKNVTIYEAYKMFINEQLFRNNSKRTLIWYNENLSAFFNWLGENKNVDSLTVENYKSYCTFLQHDYVAQSYIFTTNSSFAIIEIEFKMISPI